MELLAEKNNFLTMEQAGGFSLMCFLPERHTAKKMHLTVQFRFHFKCSMDMACPASPVILLSVLFLIFKQFYTSY